MDGAPSEKDNRDESVSLPPPAVCIMFYINFVEFGWIIEDFI